MYFPNNNIFYGKPYLMNFHQNFHQKYQLLIPNIQVLIPDFAHKKSPTNTVELSQYIQ